MIIIRIKEKTKVRKMVNWKKPIQTKDERKARLVTDKNNTHHFPMGVVITNSDGSEDYRTYTNEGRYDIDKEHKLDIINVPEKRYVYLNVYKDCVVKHNSIAKADVMASSDRIAKMKVEIDETRQDW